MMPSARGNVRRRKRADEPARACQPVPSRVHQPSRRTSSIQSLRLIVGYKLLACLLADTQLTDYIPVAVRIVRLEIVQ